jgi:HEAT repeat protein
MHIEHWSPLMICRMSRKSMVLSLFVGLASAVWVGAQDRPLNALLPAAKSGAMEDRVKAIDEIGAQGAKAASAVSDLTALLRDQSAEVRAHAAHALGEIGDPAKPAAAAITLLLKDNDQTVRRQAVKALGAIKPGPQVMIPLFVQLMEDPDAGVRQRILRAVAEAGPVAVPGLIEALKNEKAVYWACVILRDIGPEAKDAAPALTALLKSPRAEVRREAVLALGAIGPEARSADSQLAALLEDPEVQEAATLALGQIGRLPLGVESKIRANAKSDKKLLSTVSLWTIARLHPTDALAKEAAEQLISRLTDSDPFVRTTAAKALVALKLNPDITFPIYERVLANADDETMRLAMDALASQGTRAIPRLIYALKRDSLRLPAIYILGQLGPEAAVAAGALSTLVADKNAKVATEAALALAKIGPAAQTSIPKLVEALESPDCESAHAIIYALGKFGPAASPTKELLLKRLSEPDVAVISAWALTQIDPDSAETAAAAAPALVRGVADESPLKRQLAAQSLGGMKAAPPEAISALEKATQDQNESVRNAATEALRAARGRGNK